jgi:DNA-binding CsgD family transcriptional regulator
MMSNPNLGRVAEWKKDSYGRYISANEFYAEIAGLESPHSIVGKTDDDMPWRPLADAFRKGDQLVINGLGNERCGVQEKEISVYGEMDIFVREDQLTLPSTGKVIGVVGSFVDITGKRLIEAPTAGHFDNERRRFILPSQFGANQYLTATQAKVLIKVGGGGSAKHIGAELGISEKTVYAHIEMLKRKLGASNKADLSVIANESGLVFALLDIKSFLVPLQDDAQ